MTDLSRPIEITRPEAIEFGSGTAAAVGRWATARDIRRTLVVADAFNAARVEVLGLPGEVAVFGEVKPEPDIPNLAKALAAAKAARPELVVGFGGGATNAGGPAVLRYGPMRELVLGLEVALPDGTVLDRLQGAAQELDRL